ncbi:Fic family protein [Treponema primitia]|uniref:Fic family protein n=1 Tax=Treponema primitia TaxID=88058 RepID=UPI00397EC0BB
MQLAGYLKAQLSGEARYFSFLPSPLQSITLNGLDDTFYFLMAQTRHQIGVLDVLSSRIPNMDLFISMYVRKEALLSSQIEGTQATLDDILDPQAERNRNLNVAEVINYIKAVHFALDRLGKLPLCIRLLRETHGILLAGNRGGEKAPGEFRRTQNWIGPGGSTIKTASFVPPAPEDLAPALDDLERFINDDIPLTAEFAVDPLIKAALIHYQFETIHPFLDGNGRMGRLLIILYLCEKKLLSKPALYLSCFLKQNQAEYYNRLSEVRRRGSYEQWIRFFIRGIKDTTEDAIGAIEQMTALREWNTGRIASLGRSAKTARKLYAYIERNPIIEIGKTAEDLGLSFNTAAKAVNHLTALNILRPTADAKRNRCFAYEDYLAILRKDTE